MRVLKYKRKEAMDNLRGLLKISEERLQEVNDLLTDPANESVGQILEIVEKYGGPAEINRKADERIEVVLDSMQREQYRKDRKAVSESK